jgi:pimeloyl-ACP methyl ester carboxylesterase
MPSPGPTTTPIPELRYGATQSERASCLVVLLPGLGDEPQQFAAHGFVEPLRRPGTRVDATAVDAHFGYYRERIIVDRLHADVVAPARKRGYDAIWLVGISLGGLGALAYAAAHPDHVQGVVLLAPFLDMGGVPDEIRKAGGLRPWAARYEDEPSGPKAPAPWRGEPKRFFRFVWDFAAEPVRADGSRVPIYMGYGRADRYAGSQRLLAEALPTKRTLRIAGGHTWRVWEKLWDEFMARKVLHRTCCDGECSPARRGSDPR